MDFPKEILFPQKVVFEKGSVYKVGRETEEFGPRGILVYGAALLKNDRLKKVMNSFLEFAKVESYRKTPGEPTLGEISEVIQAGRASGAQWVVGIGGGSVLDLAKAAAGLFHAEREPLYYQEGGKVEKPGIPFIAVPTTAGSGSEATPNAVIINSQKKTKLSVRDAGFLARKVILDPGLLVDLPRDAMIHSTLDALVQAYESYTSKNAVWFTDSLGFKAFELIYQNLPRAINSRDDESLSSLMLASFLAGTAFASSRLGVIHGIAHPLGALYHEPHGLICAACFVSSIRVNRKAMGAKYEILSRLVGDDLKTGIAELLTKLGVQSPFRGKPILEKEKIIRETLASGSTAASPKTITREDVEQILKEIF